MHEEGILACIIFDESGRLRFVSDALAITNKKSTIYFFGDVATDPIKRERAYSIYETKSICPNKECVINIWPDLCHLLPIVIIVNRYC